MRIGNLDGLLSLARPALSYRKSLLLLRDAGPDYEEPKPKV